MRITHHIRNGHLFVATWLHGRFAYFVMDAKQDALNWNVIKKHKVKVRRVHDTGY